LQDKEAIQTLRAAAQALPEPYRAVFYMRRVKELSISEVAVSLDISEQCAKTRLHRAMGLLDSRLRGQWKHLQPN
jgi:DNA-directed RNA polymerase specialized sigma24 family protein